MIASGNKGGTRGATEGGGVEAIIANAFGGEAIHSGGGDTSTECAVLAEATVINKDEKDVGRAFGRLHRLWKLCWVGIEIGAADLTGEMEVGAWEDVGGGSSGGFRSCDWLHLGFRHSAPSYGFVEF
jgi:hypothetical protein